MGVHPEQVQGLRYRGNGWPGHFAVTLNGQSAPAGQMTYKESWGFYCERYRPYSTRLCPDGTGEDADISCGDPWYREVGEGEAGTRWWWRAQTRPGNHPQGHRGWLCVAVAARMSKSSWIRSETAGQTRRHLGTVAGVQAVRIANNPVERIFAVQELASPAVEGQIAFRLWERRSIVLRGVTSVHLRLIWAQREHRRIS